MTYLNWIHLQTCVASLILSVMLLSRNVQPTEYPSTPKNKNIFKKKKKTALDWSGLTSPSLVLILRFLVSGDLHYWKHNYEYYNSFLPIDLHKSHLSLLSLIQTTFLSPVSLYVDVETFSKHQTFSCSVLWHYTGNCLCFVSPGWLLFSWKSACHDWCACNKSRCMVGVVVPDTFICQLWY